MARKLEVEIIGDASSLQRALGQAGSSSSKLGGTLGKGLKVAALGAGAALGGLAVAAKLGFDEFAQSQKVTAQTNAVLESTGKAAHVTTKEVTALAESLMKKSGVDDEAIQSGENLLLTFTGIRNEVGKGNDIFNQATEAALDMSVAMGTDVASASLTLGKALNDPLKGMTRLQKQGVTFTDSQKEMVKRMVESGNVMGAQKLILKELNKEFGGSAEAAGKTLPGQLNILKETFMNALGDMGKTLAPFVQQLVTWATKHMPEIQAAISTAVGAIAAAFKFVAEFINKHWGTIRAVFDAVVGAVQTVVQFFKAHWPEISAAVGTAFDRIKEKIQQAIDYYNGTLKPTIQNILSAIKAFWDRFGADIIRIVGTAFNVVKANIKMVMGIIRGVIEFWMAVIRGDWSGAWNAIKTIVSSIMTGIVGILRGLLSIFATVARALGRAIWDGIVAGLHGIAGKVGDILGGIKDKIADVASSAFGWAKGIGEAIFSGIKAGVTGLTSWIMGLVRDAINAVLPGNPFHGGSGGEPKGGGRGGNAPGSGPNTDIHGRRTTQSSGGVTVNFNGPVYGNPQSIAQAVREEFVRMQRGGTKLGFT